MARILATLGPHDPDTLFRVFFSYEEAGAFLRGARTKPRSITSGYPRYYSGTETPKASLKGLRVYFIEAPAQADKDAA